MGLSLKKSYLYGFLFIVLMCSPLHGTWNYTVKPQNSSHRKDVKLSAANKVIKNHLIASGHRKLMQEKRALKMSGSLNSAWDKIVGINLFDYEALFIYPNRGFTTMSFYHSDRTRTIFDIYDGASVWTLTKTFGSPKVDHQRSAQRLEYGIQLLPSLLFFDPNLEPDWVAFKGKISVGRRASFQIEFGYNNRNNILLLFDKKTSLLTEIRSRGTWKQEGPTVDWSYRIDRYRKFNDLYLPVKCEVVAGGTIIETVEYNNFQFLETWDTSLFNSGR